MHVRLAIDRDLPAIVEMARHASAETFPHLTFSRVRTVSSFERALVTQAPVYFIAEDGRQIVGFQVVAWGDMDFANALVAEQRVIYVRPEARGGPAAGAMLRHLGAWADRLGVDELYVNVGSGRRTASTERYVRRFGFAPAGSVLKRMRAP